MITIKKNKEFFLKSYNRNHKTFKCFQCQSSDHLRGFIGNFSMQSCSIFNWQDVVFHIFKQDRSSIHNDSDKSGQKIS